MKAIYSLAVLSLMFVGANALADRLDIHANGGQGTASQLTIKASPNFVRPVPIVPVAPKLPISPKPTPNLVIGPSGL
jgi:hypothetical protein